MPLENSFDYPLAFHLCREIPTLFSTSDRKSRPGFMFWTMPGVAGSVPATHLFNWQVLRQGLGARLLAAVVRNRHTDADLETLLFAGAEKQIKAANATRLAVIGRPGSVVR